MSIATEPAIKSYFFGKGYQDLINVIKESWQRNLASAGDFFLGLNIMENGGSEPLQLYSGAAQESR